MHTVLHFIATDSTPDWLIIVLVLAVGWLLKRCGAVRIEPQFTIRGLFTRRLLPSDSDNCDSCWRCRADSTADNDAKAEYGSKINLAFDEGRKKGYKEGYNEGYDEGYDASTADSEGLFDPDGDCEGCDCGDGDAVNWAEVANELAELLATKGVALTEPEPETEPDLAELLALEVLETVMNSKIADGGLGTICDYESAKNVGKGFGEILTGVIDGFDEATAEPEPEPATVPPAGTPTQYDEGYEAGYNQGVIDGHTTAESEETILTETETAPKS